MAYGNSGRLESLEVQGSATTYGYDERSQLVSISGGGRTQTRRYREDGRLASISRAQGTTTFSYDGPFDRPTVIQSPDVTLTYSYDRGGNVLLERRQGGGLSEEFSAERGDYDAIGRLRKYLFTLDDGDTKTVDSVELGYESGYKRTSELHRRGAATLRDHVYEYEGSSDRLRRIYARETSATYASFAYDEAGNLVRKSVEGQPDLLLEWDARDTLIRASRDAGSGASVVGEYGYDADGQRIFEDSLDRGSVHAYWAGAEPVLERSGSGDTRYHYSPGQGLVSVESDGSVEDALLDTRGTTVQLGATRYATDPWGRIRGPTDEATGEVALPGPNRQVFTGHQHDLVTGLVYAKARYYDPDIGAFLSRDPLQGYDPQIPYSYNAYAYAYGNPMLYLDPTGMVSVRQGLADSCEQGGAAACAGAFTAFFGYTVLDAATFGALSREDQAIEDEEAGRISIEQRNEIFQRSIAQAAVAGAVNVATAGLGGAAAGSTAKGLVALGARQSIANVGAGAVVGGGVGVLARGAKDVGAGELSSVGEYATEGAYGALIGAGLATIAEVGGAVARRRVTAESSSGKRTYVTKAAEGPSDPGLATRGYRPRAGTRNVTREQYRELDSRRRAIRNALTDASGNPVTAEERAGVLFTIRRVEEQGFRVAGAVKSSGNQGIDVAFQGVGANAGRVALAEAKSSPGLNSLKTDTLGIRQGSYEFFRTRAERAGRQDILDALSQGRADLFGGFARSGRLFRFNPALFFDDLVGGFRANPGAATLVSRPVPPPSPPSLGSP